MTPTISHAGPLDHFTAHPHETLATLRASGDPVELTAADGQVVVIQDAVHYRKLLADIDRLETVAALKESFQDTTADRTLAVRDAFAELARKHNLAPSREVQ